MTKNYRSAYAIEAAGGLYRPNNRGGVPYNISPDRLPSSNRTSHRYPPRATMLQSNGGRQVDSDFDEKPRKRIPVACTRCRQRKIKCSGQKLHSEIESCDNCLTAGSQTECTFDRVNSNFVAYKNDLDEYPCDANAGRMYQARYLNQSNVSYSPSSSIYPNNSVYIPSNVYRTPAMPEQFSKGQDCYGNPYNHQDYSEEGSNFNIGASSFPVLNQNDMNAANAYTQHNPNKGWAQPNRVDGGMYIESSLHSASYPVPMWNQTPQYPIRNSISNDGSTNFSFTNMASSLPTPPPLAGNDRILPMPSANSSNRNEGALLSLSRTAETMGYNTVPMPMAHDIQGRQGSSIGSMNNNGLSYSHPSGSSLSLNNGSAQFSCSPESVVTYSSAGGYGPAPPSSHQSGNEVYTPPSTSPPSSHFGHEHHNLQQIHTLRSQNSQGELSLHPSTYYVADGHRGSQSMGDVKDGNDSEGLDVRGHSLLANGHMYQPLTYNAEDLERRGSHVLGADSRDGRDVIAINENRGEGVKLRVSKSSLRA